MDIVFRAFAAFVFIFVLLRVIGRRELSSLEPFDLILLVVIGDLVQQGVTQSDMSLTGTALAVGTFALLVVATSWLSFRFRPARKVLEASPLVVMEHGKPIEKNMRAERLTLEELAAAARLQQVASFDEVEWAILEGGGQISFITRSSDR
ncbi:MAG TPA: YetF domain-containing protein [Gaiella sp.]|nr:YetF domain-containing protein [Gaiella sp.]